MYRLEYEDMIPVTEWFGSEVDAMKIVKRLKLKEYNIRFIHFPFIPDATNIDGNIDPDGNTIYGNEGATLHWLNRWATKGRS